MGTFPVTTTWALPACIGPLGPSDPKFRPERGGCTERGVLWIRRQAGKPILHCAVATSRRVRRRADRARFTRVTKVLGDGSTSVRRRTTIKAGAKQIRHFVPGYCRAVRDKNHSPS